MTMPSLTTQRLVWQRDSLAQSVSMAQFFRFGQEGQSDPPQSMSVSDVSLLSFAQLLLCKRHVKSSQVLDISCRCRSQYTPLTTHVPRVQNLLSQSEDLLQPWPKPHFLAQWGPPQSTPVSLPLILPSEQVAAQLARGSVVTGVSNIALKNFGDLGTCKGMWRMGRRKAQTSYAVYKC